MIQAIIEGFEFFKRSARKAAKVMEELSDAMQDLPAFCSCDETIKYGIQCRRCTWAEEPPNPGPVILKTHLRKQRIEGGLKMIVFHGHGFRPGDYF